MHARVTTLKIRPDALDQTVTLYQQQIMPIIKAQAGFQGVYLMTDRATGSAVSITMWNSEAEGRAYESNGTYRQLVGMVAANFAAPPTLATYEVEARG
ncbi:MAG TPA: antibiotic biosynthesis monooxygenase [Ktedonobacterales bacterium]|nr:antibiotic biosynthesis monooxygenase [Ktedonobacterales bacterium]